jgi:uncharacterized membrane protein YhaH (DUF805 family)
MAAKEGITAAPDKLGNVTREGTMEDWVKGLIILAAFFAIIYVPFIRIFQKAGRSGWWAVLMVIPLINIIVLWIFAFSNWPALDRR